MHLNLLRDFIFEVVIDASGSFAKRRADAFGQRIQKLAGDMPDVFRRQEEQEREINARLAAVALIPDGFVSQKRLRMAVPKAFDPDTGVAPGTPVFTVIEVAHPREPDYADLTKFVQANAERFQAALAAVKQAMVDIEHDADAMEWPAPWRRYTQWASWYSSVNHFESNLKKMLASK